MKSVIFDSYVDPTVAILIKATALNESGLREHYVNRLVGSGTQESNLIAFELTYTNNKVTAAQAKEYVKALLPELQSLGVKHLYVPDAVYFKVLANVSEVDPHIGYVLQCAVKGYEHMTVTLGINYQQLFYKPELREKLDSTVDALASFIQGSYSQPGGNIIHSAYYPKYLPEIKATLEALHQYPELACDIETFSLFFKKAGIGTIAFAWDQHNGVAFPVSHVGIERYNERNFAEEVNKYLKEFFTSYKGKLRFHRGTYDIKCLIYELWMKDDWDTEGLLEGLDILTRNVDDTLLIAYLASNSTSKPPLSLKYLAQEFAGNYAVEVKDIRNVSSEDLLEYNLIDCLCTNYVYDKYYPIMVQDQQEELYKGLFLDSMKLIIQLEMTGMPMSRRRIGEIDNELREIRKKSLQTIGSNKYLKLVEALLQEKAWEKDFEDRRGKAKNPLKIIKKPREAFDHIEFNPNSGTQLQVLLYERMGLPVLDTTDTGAPATGADTLEKLINHTNDPDEKDLIQALIEHGKVSKILNTFIPAFKGASHKDASDTVWLHGSFNLGGTVSGRLSSSDPNLQNLPAGSIYGDLIKTGFNAPKGWIFAGADFNSLEDYISALTTKDSNKLDVYLKGYDGHCLRAAYYFRDELQHIDLNDPKSVNTIKDTHPELRQLSKAPTFLLTYGGSYLGLMGNLGWDKEKALKIETNYHELYKESDEYVQDKLKQASIDGYLTVAFGLRVRTPLLKQVVWGGPKMPSEAAAEGRTAGNALGQSYGLLNNRAAVAFFKKVWDSPYRTKILPVALVHDAIYILMEDSVEVVQWANKNLIDEMKWQELPELEHPTVKLGANLDLFWPSWVNGITLPNNASHEDILKLCAEARAANQ